MGHRAEPVTRARASSAASRPRLGASQLIKTTRRAPVAVMTSTPVVPNPIRLGSATTRSARVGFHLVTSAWTTEASESL